MKQTSERLEFKDSGFLFMLLIGGSFVIFGLLMGGFLGYFFALPGLILSSS